jgi:outer membrane protein TolC
MHPTVREGAAQAQAAAAAREAASLAYRPTLLVQGVLSARGSGALLNGTINNGQGLWPDVPNWTAGVSITFPLFDFGATRARVAQRTSLVTAADARQRTLTDEATGAAREARVMVDAARRIAGTVPMRLTAARDAAAQARARYDAGLTGIVDVVEAERVLAQANAEAALAALALWRARLALAAAAGDLTPFVAEAAAPTGPPVVP